MNFVRDEFATKPREQRALVTLAEDGTRRESDQLARELQDFVKTETAPYKYPRRIRFVRGLPKTTSGKIARAALRESL